MKVEGDEEESPNHRRSRGSDENRRPPFTFTPGSLAWARPYRLPKPPKKTIRKHEFSKQSYEVISKNATAGPQSERVIWFHCLCGKKYLQRCYLSKHVSTQMNDKVFKCLHPDCSKRFNYQQSLKDHVKRKHTGDYDGRGEYGCWCHSCGMHFKTMEDHRIHRKNRHAEIKLGKPKIGLPPSPKQPAITRFLMPRTAN